ncbi:MAG TPA: hypothetical protein VFG20_05085 [Planctomycetaceae bacterium]|nr:hypothetical protein [Planctomycetaceae bacterium]
MKATTFNLCLSAVLLTLAIVNWVGASWDRSVHASNPMCGGVTAPGANCTCCEESQTWYCE